MKTLMIAAGLILIAVPAFAQGGSPYNSSGSQAGGPRAGQERRMGGGSGGPAMDPAPAARPMKAKTHRRAKHHSRHRGM